LDEKLKTLGLTAEYLKTDQQLLRCFMTNYIETWKKVSSHSRFSGTSSPYMANKHYVDSAKA